MPVRGGTVCYKHGGGAPQVKRAARNRIAHLIDPAIEVLEERLQDKSDRGHALSAAKDVLDCAGLKTAEAFDLNKEPRQMRARYGEDPFGQGCLLARRLVEKGVRYVEVKFKKSWDVMHRGMTAVEDLAATLDGPFSELLKDLESRGMLKRTLVVLATEFGRSPKINQSGGRDHHPKVFSCVFAGGGVKGGQAIGKTDPNGQGATGETYGYDRDSGVPDSNVQMAEGDIYAGLVHAMGIDTGGALPDMKAFYT